MELHEGQLLLLEQAACWFKTNQLTWSTEFKGFNQEGPGKEYSFSTARRKDRVFVQQAVKFSVWQHNTAPFSTSMKNSYN
jgi:hypothetical protein